MTYKELFEKYHKQAKARAITRLVLAVAGIGINIMILRDLRHESQSVTAPQA